MLDHSWTPRTTAATTETFNAHGAVGTVAWQSWIKPRNISMVYIKLIGAGAGGGGGMTGAAGTARGGGGGGGSGAITDLLIPAFMLPDVLYVMVGMGGPGGVAAAVGTVGERSYVSMVQNNTAIPMLIGVSGAANATAGGAGTAGAGGAAGVSSTIGTSALAMGHNYGISFYRVGAAGSAGGAQTGAAGGTLNFAIPGVTGGSGGGGTPIANTDFAGGPINAAGFMPTVVGGVAAAGAGQPGFNMITGNPTWTTTGGTGGGTAGAAGTAGKGGKGGIGSGGGGGGGGVTGGAGGDGGNGLVVFCCW